MKVLTQVHLCKTPSSQQTDQSIVAQLLSNAISHHIYSQNGSSCLLVSLSEKTLIYLMYTITFRASQRVMRSHQVCDPHPSLAFLSFCRLFIFCNGVERNTFVNLL